jgi:hypothetical protein
LPPPAASKKRGRRKDNYLFSPQVVATETDELNALCVCSLRSRGAVDGVTAGRKGKRDRESWKMTARKEVKKERKQISKNDDLEFGSLASSITFPPSFSCFTNAVQRS